MNADIVRLVGKANSIQDNLDLENFKKQNTLKPLIAFNLGSQGKLSQVLNGTFTLFPTNYFQMMKSS